MADLLHSGITEERIAAAATAKGARQAASFALLKKNEENQNQTVHDVDKIQNSQNHFSAPLSCDMIRPSPNTFPGPER
jgi:hypothetical protein